MPSSKTTMRTLVTIAGLIVATIAGASAGPDAGLHIETRPDGLVFQLTDAGGTGPWLLQQSRDGRNWEDVKFWDGEGGELPELSVSRAILAEPDAREGLFRAVRLDSDDPFRRRFLTERTKWRLSGINSYQYELSQNFGQISWRGTVNVVDGEVDSFTTLDQWPPGFEPNVSSIDGLFTRIANAIAANAVTINVTWDRDHGAPLTCYIDLDERLADEESGWSITTFTPAP